MSPLDAAVLRFGRAALEVMKPSVAEQVRRAEREPGELQEGEASRLAAEVDRLTGLLAR